MRGIYFKPCYIYCTFSLDVVPKEHLPFAVCSHSAPWWAISCKHLIACLWDGLPGERSIKSCYVQWNPRNKQSFFCSLPPIFRTDQGLKDAWPLNVWQCSVVQTLHWVHGKSNSSKACRLRKGLKLISRLLNWNMQHKIQRPWNLGQDLSHCFIGAFAVLCLFTTAQCRNWPLPSGQSACPIFMHLPTE